MADIKDQLIKDSYNYVLQSDLTTGVVYRIGGSIPINPIFSSGLTVNDSFTYSNGSEQPGYVLTTDGTGYAYWSQVSGGTGSSGNYLPLSGGTVFGNTIFTSGLTATTLTFDTITAITPSLAKINWNQTDKTLEFGYGDGNTTIQIGQEMVYPPVVNKDSIDLVEGTLVMVDPTDVAQGNRLRIVRAVTNGTYPSQLLVGILTENISKNNEGYATWFGYVRNLNIPTLESNGIKPVSETWVEGNILYPNPNTQGGLTINRPGAPSIDSTIAAITSINGNNLTLLVRPLLTFTLTELNDVALKPLSALTDTSVLSFSSNTGVWVDRNIVGKSGVSVSSTQSTIDISFTGGTITGNTIYTSGLTATTISANTLSLPFTTGSVIFQGSGGTLTQNNSNLFWDNTNSRLGIGTNIPGSQLELKSGTVSLRAYSDNIYQYAYFGTQSSHPLSIVTSDSTRLQVKANGNVLIGTTTDAGYLLDVNGNARVASNFYLNNFSRIISANNAIDFQSFRMVHTAYWNTLNSQYAYTFENGGGNANLITGTTGRMSLDSAFGPTAGNAVYNTFLISSTVNQTGGASGVTRGVYINPTLTSAYDFRAIETTVGNVMLNTLSGNTLIGKTTDLGQKLQVSGNTLLQGGLTATTISATSVSTNFTTGSVIFQGSTGTLSQNNSNLFWDNSNSRLGININTPAQALEVWGTGYVSGRVGLGSSYPGVGTHLLVTGQLTGAVIAYGIRQAGYVQNDVTLYGVGFHNRLNKTGGSTLPTYYNFFTQGNGSISGTVTNQMGFAVGNDLTNATNNYAFHSELASASGVWNLYMNGSALNYLNGSLLIGTTTDAGYKLDVNGNVRVSTIYFNGVATTANIGATSSSLEFNTPTSFGVFNFNCSNGGRRVSINGTSSDTVGNDLLSIPFVVQNTTGTNRNFSMLNVNPTINNTASYTGIVRGLYYNPTITSLTGTDHRAIETTVGNVMLNTVSGNTLIGKTTDTGQKLQVSGDTLIQGSLTATTKTTIGSESDISCALLQMASTTQGVLFPRMTNTQRTSISSPVAGLMVYCTDSPEGLFIYKSTGWVQII